MKKYQDKDTVSNATHEINYIAKKLGVTALSIHLAKHFVGNKRFDITLWIEQYKGTVLAVDIK